MPQAQSVSFQSGDTRLKGYLTGPEGEGPHPGVVIIHEARGLNDNIKGVAGRLAQEGYVALAVDLFAGRNRAACMFRLLGGLLFNPLGHGGISDLKAALSF